MNQELIDELEAIEIKKGDIIVDHMSGYVGVVIFGKLNGQLNLQTKNLEKNQIRLK